MCEGERAHPPLCSFLDLLDNVSVVLEDTKPMHVFVWMNELLFHCAPWAWGHRVPFCLHRYFFSLFLLLSFCRLSHFLFPDDLVDASCALIFHQFGSLIPPEITTRKNVWYSKSVDRTDPKHFFSKDPQLFNTNTYLSKDQLDWTSRSMTRDQHCQNK